jgi:para-aminobenzoate synthetase/4-amino-4-deoxychorismate lyase
MTSHDGVLARFDDLTCGTGGSFRLEGPQGEIVARTHEEVLPALRSVQEASEAGLWAAGWVSYEASPGLDPHLQVRAHPPGDPFAELPLVWFGLFDRRVDDELLEPVRTSAIAPPDTWEPSISRDAYDAAIGRIHDFIAAGDTYQVNFTMRLRSDLDLDDLAFYGDLCRAQRAAYTCYLNAGRYRILSASPELFFRIDGRRILMRPMKGTIKRGRWVEEDLALVDRLQGSIKDRAENAMIVDLLRNDLGRIADAGSVRWPRVFTAERYETVWQLTSSIVARLPEGIGFGDTFAALFPSGSITGAPKVRTMEIISELETTPRGVYCGSAGWVAPAGHPGPRSMFNVAIRTVTLDAETSTAEYGVGGGITWDSRAGAEYDECLAKAQVLTARRPVFELLETMPWYATEGFLWLDRHLDRMTASAEFFKFCFDREQVRRAMEQAAVERGSEVPSRVRVMVSRSGRVSIEWLPLPAPATEPVRVALDDQPVHTSQVFLYHKTTDRRSYQERAARRPDVDDVLMVNERGEVTEATIANVAVKLDDAWWTPPIGSGCMPGVYRALMLQEGRISERPITVEDVRQAQGLALLNSVRLWRPAVLVSDPLPSGGPRSTAQVFR